MSDGLLRSGKRNWSGSTSNSGEFSELFKQPFKPSEPSRHRPSPLAREFPHLAGRGERAARPPRRVPNTFGPLRRANRLLGPYGWLLDLPGFIEDVQTTGDWLFGGDDWAKTAPNLYHSNFALVFTHSPQTNCFGSAGPHYGNRGPAYVPNAACVNASFVFNTFEDSAATPNGQMMGGHVMYSWPHPAGFGQNHYVWKRIGLGPTSPFVVVPMPKDLPGPLAEPMEKEYPKPDVLPEVHSKPWERPAVNFLPDGPPGGVPGIHEELPPKPGDEEIKKKMDMGVAGQIYGELTEFRDMMDCFAEASGMKPPKGTIGKRARAIYEHLNATNPDGTPRNPINTYAFAKCMALANAQDFAIGKLSNETAKRLNRSPLVASRPEGYRGGGWGTRMLNLGG